MNDLFKVMNYAKEQIDKIDMDDLGDPEEPFEQGVHMGQQAGSKDAYLDIFKHCEGLLYNNH